MSLLIAGRWFCRLVPGFFSLAVGLCAAGCRVGAPETGFERYIPDPQAARDAVAATLEAWRGDDHTETIAGSQPPVHVVDKQRKPGQRLTRFEILGEISAENARCFAVRLQFDDSDDEQIARYLVVGRDPRWVFRQEDYERISHWMHEMKEPPDQAPGPGLDPKP